MTLVRAVVAKALRDAAAFNAGRSPPPRLCCGPTPSARGSL